MEICLGMVGMQPSEFWNSSIHEIHCAIEGFKEFNGTSHDPLTKSELDNLMELYPD